MGSKSLRDGESPSASSVLLPQLRHSRRGSLASLASANQLDKESLSQALDQIHSTASQTETLTTFNEYTSPPTSSSGPDTKGIASELQGGLSGLYSRFRASVGTVKDIVNPGIEDAAVENAPLKSPRAATSIPKPLSKNILESARDLSSSNSTTQATSATGSGRQSPLFNVDTDGEHQERRQSLKPSTKSLGSASISGKSLTGSLVPLKPPHVTLTQATQLTTISPALADVNAGAVNRLDAGSAPFPVARNTTPVENQSSTRVSRMQSYHTEPLPQGAVDAPNPTPSDVIVPRHGSQGGPKQPKDIPVPSNADSAFDFPNEHGIVGLRAVSTDSVRPFPDLEAGSDEAMFDLAGGSANGKDSHLSRPATTVTKVSNGQNDIFSAPNRTNTRGTLVDDPAKTAGGYQHMDAPLRKTVAPPLITRSHSSNLSLSRASISDTESLDSSPFPTRPQKVTAESHGAHPTQNIGSQHVTLAATHRASRTMNVFSQVKNKVLNKEYWMKDENARDCFYCGDSFSTFRRKHHCSKFHH